MSGISSDTGLPSKKEEMLIRQYNVTQTGFNVDYGRPKRRGKYKTTAVQNRIQDFISRGINKKLFGFFKPIHKRELVFAIKMLGLARDKLAVTQYLERFLLYRYFSVNPSTGVFQLDSLTPQTEDCMSHNDMKKLMLTIRGVTVKQRRRGSF